jgi:uncharacterized protein YfaQ (DUF2300 family)
VQDDAGAVAATRVVMEWTGPMAWPLDGEETAPTTRFDVEILPAALHAASLPGHNRSEATRRLVITTRW